MATRATLGASAPTLPLDVLLGAIPSLPRPLLSRLTARLIERMDELDGDSDFEDDDPAGTEEGDQPAFTGHWIRGSDGRRYRVPANMRPPRTGF